MILGSHLEILLNTPPGLLSVMNSVQIFVKDLFCICVRWGISFLSLFRVGPLHHPFPLTIVSNFHKCLLKFFNCLQFHDCL